MPQYDAIVVGAGPGGCVAAFFLEHYSAGRLKVLMLERLDESKYPRYHRMCGEGISRRAFKDLRPLEPMCVTSEIDRAIEHWPGGITFEVKGDGYIIDRPQLLKALVKRFEGLGGVVEQETVSSVTRGGPGYELSCHSGRIFECSSLIGADGAHSVVRRDIFGSQPRSKLVADQYILDRTTLPNAIQFFYDERYGGAYRWEFPSGTRTRVGFPNGTDPVPEDPLETHRRVIAYGGVGKIAEGRACLVGDAAAQINPLTFGGLRNSMVAGKMAARAIVSGDVQKYEKRWLSSKYASPYFWDALVQLQAMDNSELMETVEHMGPKATVLNNIGAYVKKKKLRRIIWAYMLAQGYGW